MTTTLAEGAPMTDSATILQGGCAVWPLPHTPMCATVARSIITRTLPRLITDPDRLDDWLVMTSELATNAWLHGLGGRELDDRYAPASGRSELAIYRRGAGDNAEVVVTIFDPDPNLDAIPAQASSSLTDVSEIAKPDILSVDSLEDLLPGRRGLDLVHALSGGRCGFYRTRSRMGAAPVSGKAVWFAIAAGGSSVARPPAIEVSPAQTVRLIETHLDSRDVGRAYHSDLRGESVLSLPSVTVWCRDQKVRWRDGGREVCLPVYDLVEAVERIVELSEDATHGVRTHS